MTREQAISLIIISFAAVASALFAAVLKALQTLTAMLLLKLEKMQEDREEDRQQIAVNTGVLKETAAKVYGLENGVGDAKIDNRLTVHGLIDTEGNSNATAIQQPK